jgi:FkbM family methyltransferase
MPRPKLLFVAPHLSTGGMPQYVVKLTESLLPTHEVHVLEYHDISPEYIVQKNTLRTLIGDRLVTLYGTQEEKDDQFLAYLARLRPDIVHLQEIPEMWMSERSATALYAKDRPYVIVETSHDSGFDPTFKRFFPDSFAFISKFHPSQYSAVLTTHDIPYEIVEYPIELHDRPDRTSALAALGLDPAYIHVLNVGLFTPRKNQAEIFEVARRFEGERIVFHFVGNTADNFEGYWRPLLANTPSNCHVWGERSDVDAFYGAMDLFLFSSRGHDTDRETNPIVLKEAISWRMPVMMYNLPVYCGMYNDAPGVTFMTSPEDCASRLAHMFGMRYDAPPAAPAPPVVDPGDVVRLGWIPSENKITIDYSSPDPSPVKYKVSIRDMVSTAPMYWFDFEAAGTASWYVVPIPVKMHDFQADELFKGFRLEFYSRDGAMAFARELVIHPDAPARPVLGFTNPFDCGFVNYDQFFVQDMYGKRGIVPRGTVIDVGANVGLFAKYAYGKGADRVILVEANPELGRDIDAMLGKDAKRSAVYLKALHDEHRELQFSFSTENSTIGSTVFHASDPRYSNLNRTTTVATVTLDDIISEQGIERIGLFKCDIEGGEYDVFRGMRPDHYAMIDEFLVEYHRNESGEIHNLLDPLHDNGFTTDVYNEDMTPVTGAMPYPGTIHAYRATNPSGARRKVNRLVKLVHMQTTRGDDREVRSAKSLAPLADYGIRIVTHRNEPYSSPPPRHNCARPDCLGDGVSEYGTPIGETSLTPAHYGCYESFRLAALREFDPDVDYLIMCEGDCILEVPPQEFVDRLNESFDIIERNSIAFMSFGDTATLDLRVPQSLVKEEVPGQDLLFVTNKVIGLQCIMFPSSQRPFLQDAFQYDKWDAADIFLNNAFSWAGRKIAIVKRRLTTQADGFSLVDNAYRKFER